MAGGDLDGDVYFATWNPLFKDLEDRPCSTIQKKDA